MEVITHPNGPFMVNSYIIINGEKALIIDPGSDVRFIIEHIRSNNLRPEAILATHGHIDHVQGVNILKSEFEIPFYMNSLDNPLLEGLSMQAQMFGVKNPGKITVDHNLPLSGEKEFIGLKLKFFHTPGHSKGSVSIKINDVLFAGDVLFQYSIGRTDLPGGNMKELLGSIRKHLFTMPDSTKVFPGHGPTTTIGQEKRNNPFLQ